MQEIQCNTVYMQGYFYVIFTFYILKHKSKKGQKFPCLQYATAMNSRCAIKCNKSVIYWYPCSGANFHVMFSFKKGMHILKLNRE